MTDTDRRGSVASTSRQSPRKNRSVPRGVSRVVCGRGSRGGFLPGGIEVQCNAPRAAGREDVRRQSSGGFGGEAVRTEARRRDRVVAAVRVLAATRALLLDVGDLTVGSDFPVVAGDAAAPERGESEETDETHHVTPTALSAIPVPVEVTSAWRATAVRGRRRTTDLNAKCSEPRRRHRRATAAAARGGRAMCHMLNHDHQILGLPIIRATGREPGEARSMAAA